MTNLATYPPQDEPNRFFTHEEVIQSQTRFQPLFTEILGTGVEIDTMNAISILSHFINHVLHVEKFANGWSAKKDKLTRMVEFSYLERGIALPATTLDGRELHWDYEKGKLNDWLDHMGLKVERCPEGHHTWSYKTRMFLGDRLKAPSRRFYEVYEAKLIDYPCLAFLAEYMSMQLLQLAGRIEVEQDRKIVLFLAAAARLGSVDLTHIMETRSFLSREKARLFIEKPAEDVGVTFVDHEPYPFCW